MQWGQERGGEEFDADTEEHMRWVYEKAVKRADEFGIHDYLIFFYSSFSAIFFFTIYLLEWIKKLAAVVINVIPTLFHYKLFICEYDYFSIFHISSYYVELLRSHTTIMAF